MTSSQTESFYDAVGGHETFVRLVRTFYVGVAADPELRALYPDEDLGPAEVHLRMFLEQYWGGPTTYSKRRGHPRLGMRHAPFAVTPRARDLWLAHMRTALQTSGMTDEQVGQFWAYVSRAAHFLVNSADEPDNPPDLISLEETPSAPSRRRPPSR